MTLEQFEKIALFMGWENGKEQVRPFCREGIWIKPNGRQITAYNKTSLTDSEAVELLNVLVEKGQLFTLNYEGDGRYSCLVSTPHMIAPRWKGEGKTIPEAVAAAALALIEREERRWI